MTKCVNCGIEFEPTVAGRPRKTCSTPCRKALHRRGKREARQTPVEGDKTTFGTIHPEGNVPPSNPLILLGRKGDKTESLGEEPLSQNLHLDFRVVKVNPATYKVVGDEKIQHPRADLLPGHRAYRVLAWIIDIGVSRLRWRVRIGDRVAKAKTLTEARKKALALVRGSAPVSTTQGPIDLNAEAVAEIDAELALRKVEEVEAPPAPGNDNAQLVAGEAA